ncbi:MAG: hypothetical protein K2L05_00865, partial [Muribaculaceae bacterium]|nr:hypothetical protein [Muribaculaceae bacterium]
AENRPWVAELGQGMTVSLRTPQWKLIPAANHDRAELSWPATGHNGNIIELGDSTQPQLFNVASDPNETTNLAAEKPEKVAELTELWKKVVPNK